MLRIIFLTVLLFYVSSSHCAQQDQTNYIAPTIGNVAPFLVPTYPTIQLPNQMMRMFPVKKDYISDQVTAFPLQVTGHRRPGMFQTKVTLGNIKDASWKNKMNIDHDLENVKSWLYSAYISLEQANINFEKELVSKSFDKLVQEGKETRGTVINQIEVEGGTGTQKRTFYTSLYRTYERMININEYGKYYSGYDGKVQKSDRPFYVDDWVRDTYRASHPLRTILTPQKEYHKKYRCQKMENLKRISILNYKNKNYKKVVTTCEIIAT